MNSSITILGRILTRLEFQCRRFVTPVRKSITRRRSMQSQPYLARKTCSRRGCKSRSSASCRGLCSTTAVARLHPSCMTSSRWTETSRAKTRNKPDKRFHTTISRKSVNWPRTTGRNTHELRLKLATRRSVTHEHLLARNYLLSLTLLSKRLIY